MLWNQNMVLLLFLCLPTAAAASEPGDLEPLTVVNYDDRHIGWSSGNLTADVSGVKEAISLQFTSEGGSKLTSLKLSSRSWTLNLTSIVKDLPSPVPNRSVLVITNSLKDGDATEMSISIPFGLEPTNADKSGPTCKSIDIFIDSGHVSKTQILPHPDERCIY